MPQWTTLWEVSWPDVFAAQGNVDLSTAGDTITVDGVTLRTPNVADGDPNDMVSPTQFELTANGLEVELDGAAQNCTFDAAPDSPALLATMDAIGTALGFDPDPSRMYMLQCYVSAFSSGTVTTGLETAGTGVWRRDSPRTTLRASFGRDGTDDDIVMGATTRSTSMADRLIRTDLATHMIVGVQLGPSSVAASYLCWEPPGGAFSWPAFGATRLICGETMDPAAIAELQNARPGDAFHNHVAVMFAEKFNDGDDTTYTIERFRLLRQ